MSHELGNQLERNGNNEKLKRIVGFQTIINTSKVTFEITFYISVKNYAQNNKLKRKTTIK